MSDAAIVPDYCEPVIGWRVWHCEAPLYLASAWHTIWPPREKLIATHVSRYDYYMGADKTCAESPCHSSFAPGCGIYCFKTDEWLHASIRITGPRPVIVGRVALWGRIAEHYYGYRGQFAYPVSLHYAFNMGAVDAAALAASYGIPFQEQPQWTSAQSNDDSWQSHYGSPFQVQSQYYQNIPIIIPKAWAGVVPTPRPSPRPKSKSRLASEQPTFNKHKSVHWVMRDGMWVRSDDDATP